MNCLRLKLFPLALLAMAACSIPLGSAVMRPPDALVLRDTDGSPRPLDAELAAHRYTVVTFFSNHCACMRLHDPRVRDLMAKEGPRDVGFLIVDSEEGATLGDDATEARSRGYRIVLDDGSKLARALDAEYATYSVILDKEGNVLYRGGFDSNRSHLTDDRTEYLAEALDDLHAGVPLRHAETKALGCT